ncbi:MAG: gamma-glutamylcyclotransferase [Clostridium sp.]|nr:gamma-glutamylcyclotransferase [Clostridium sp.]
MRRMSKKYYIAYGSNLSVEQMAHRCPEAKVAGMAALKNWKLVFRTHATIEPCEGRVVPVLIWEISQKDENNLDRYEGWPEYYRKENMAVTMTGLDGKNAQEITAMVYIMEDGHKRMPPRQGYYDVLAEGYERFGFNPYQLELALKEAREGSR